MYREEFALALKIVLEATLEVYGNRLVSLAVFGSVGRGTPRPDSDIDLLLVAESLPRGRVRRMAEFERVEEIVASRTGHFKYIRPDLSPVIKTKDEVLQGSFLFLDLVEDAKILYDRGGFLTRYLAALKEKLHQMGAKRIYHKGSWYWILKEDYLPGEVIEI